MAQSRHGFAVQSLPEVESGVEGNEAIDAHVEVKAELLVDVVANLPGGSPRQSKEALSASGHAGSSTLNTASAYLRQADSSALNWRRPAGVSA